MDPSRRATGPTSFPQGDTPRRANQEKEGLLSAECQAAVDNLQGQTLEVSFEHFCSHLLHMNVSDSSVEECIAALYNTDSPVIEHSGDEWMWVDLPPEPYGNEDRFCSILERLALLICEWYHSNHNGAVQTAKLRFEPRKMTASAIEGGLFLTDADSYLTKSNEPTRIKCNFTVDISANWEFRIGNSEADIKDNRKKLVGRAAHIMNSDPCRTHIYSMSIERYDARAWYFSRSHAVKSEAFDLRKDPASLIRFVIAMSFSRPEDLGFDPTVTRHYDATKGDIFYVYKVENQYFKAVRPICEYFPASILGRATRIWPVQECDASGKVTIPDVKVLKDYWLGARETEWEIQGKIFDELEKLKVEVELKGSDRILDGLEKLRVEAEKRNAFDEPEKSKVGAEKQLLTFADKLPTEQKEQQLLLNALKDYKSYFVVIGKSEIVGRTRAMCPTYAVGDVGEKFSSKTPLSSQAPGSPSISCPFGVKQHCRLIYNECCKPVHELRNAQTITSVMIDCVTGIQLLYLAGYVHRDISTGNVYYDPAAQRGKLSDFEYAKRVDRIRPEDISPDPKTGTPAFMATEVKTGSYLLWQYTGDHTELKPSFRHNYIHDIESTFWLGLWLFTTTTMTSDPEPLPRKTATYILRLFQDNSIRQKVISGDVFEGANNPGITHLGLLRKDLPHDLFAETFPAYSTDILIVFLDFLQALRWLYRKISRIGKVYEAKEYCDIFLPAKTSFRRLGQRLESAPMSPFTATTSEQKEDDENEIKSDSTEDEGEFYMDDVKDTDYNPEMECSFPPSHRNPPRRTSKTLKDMKRRLSSSPPTESPRKRKKKEE
ncbi:hypothetical protein VKT23_011878 [Stygiomarasmius scandens]|uniref:Protein kinase domain-containing protein n=1 Tax=Marasmiellus scandens TaxID=2682957 RepID=A0ABR1JCR2_9AGAR